MLIDSHAHLDDSKYDRDRDEVIKKLKEDGVELVINPGADFSSSVKAVSLAEKYEMIYAAVGVHPHDAKDVDEGTLEVFKELAKKEKVIAIGEIGLDYHYEFSDREIQKKWFREQIKLAKELNLPIIVHDREAHKDTYDIISSEQDGTLTGVLHCFSGSLEMAKEYIKLGFYVSFGGPVTFKNAKKVREVVKELPIEKMLIETDSPYMAPHPHRGKRNEPKMVYYVAEMIAQVKGLTYDEVCKITNKNVKDLFKIK